MSKGKANNQKQTNNQKPRIRFLQSTCSCFSHPEIGARGIFMRVLEGCLLPSLLWKVNLCLFLQYYFWTECSLVNHNKCLLASYNTRIWAFRKKIVSEHAASALSIIINPALPMWTAQQAEVSKPYLQELCARFRLKAFKITREQTAQPYLSSLLWNLPY